MPTSPLYTVTPGQAADTEDLNQLVQTLQGVVDGPVALYPPLAAPPAPTVAVKTGSSGNQNGAYQYRVTYVTGLTSDAGTIRAANTTAASAASATVSPVDQAVTVGITLGPTGVVERILYRTKAGGAVFYYLTTITDNTTTSYTDTAADTALGTDTAPTVNTTGGGLGLAVYDAVPGYTAPAGTVVGVQTTANGLLTLYAATGSAWQALPTLGAAQTWSDLQTYDAGIALPLLTSDPASPVAGQLAVINDAWSLYDGALWRTGAAINVAQTWTALQTLNAGWALPLLSANPASPVAGQVAIHDSSTLGGYVAEVWTGTAWQNVAGPAVAYTDVDQYWNAPQTMYATGPSGQSSFNYPSQSWSWDYVASGVTDTVTEYVDQFGDWTLAVGGSPVAQISKTGALTTVGGQSTVGPVGVGAVVGVTEAQVVTSTATTGILSVSAPVSGLYLVAGYVWISNGTSGNAITFSVGWTDPDTGTGGTVYFNLGSTSADGSNSFANGLYSASSLLVYLKGGQAVVVRYQDPTNTPSDTVSAVVVRLT